MINKVTLLHLYDNRGNGNHDFFTVRKWVFGTNFKKALENCRKNG